MFAFMLGITYRQNDLIRTMVLFKSLLKVCNRSMVTCGLFGEKELIELFSDCSAVVAVNSGRPSVHKSNKFVEIIVMLW